MANVIEKFGAIIIAALTLIYTIYINKSTDRIRKQIESVQLNVLQASSLYENVKTMKREYTGALQKLAIVSTEDNPTKGQVMEAFLELYSKYTEFFNEINDYCIKVNCGAIKAEEYIKDTVSVSLSKFADMQVETYVYLKGIEEKYEYIAKTPRPDYNAFKEYDKFLIEYNGGENSSFWTTLKTKRRNCGLE